MAKKMKQFKHQNNGVVGIVAAFLIVGLIVAVISVMQTVYVPKWMKEKEADHMDKVAEQFAQLKYSIDTHSATKQEDTTISNSITLGSKEHPYLLSVRAFGSLDILEDEIQIIITSTDTTILDPITSLDIGVIKYSSYNSYYLDQDYFIEAGAVILSQSGGNIVTIKPSLSVTKVAEIDIYFNIIDIDIIGDKKAISGFGSYPVQTEFKEILDDGNDDYIFIPKVDSITIESENLEAWKGFLDGTFIKAGLSFSGATQEYTISETDDDVTFSFTNQNVNLHYKVTKIGAQMAPGWIENR